MRAPRASAEFSFLAQERGRLEFGQACVDPRFFRHLAVSLCAQGQLGLDDDVVAEKSGATEDHHRE